MILMSMKISEKKFIFVRMFFYKKKNERRLNIFHTNKIFNLMKFLFEKNRSSIQYLFVKSFTYASKNKIRKK